MTEQQFNGIVYLSKAKYDELVANGTVIIGDQTLTYDRYGTIYITPEDLSQNIVDLQTQIDEINTNKKYIHNIEIDLDTVNHNKLYFTIINDDITAFTKETLCTHIKNSGQYLTYPVTMVGAPTEHKYYFSVDGSSSTDGYLCFNHYTLEFDNTSITVDNVNTPVITNMRYAGYGTSTPLFTVTDTVTEL